MVLLRKTKHLCKFLGNKWVNFFQIKENKNASAMVCLRHHNGMPQALRLFRKIITVVCPNDYSRLPQSLRRNR